ncbi:undecaprenyl/decaprenyl-phosphate alpha-N-acetylglucosaminyl 1-phosphate transferase [Pelagibacterales bacterium SAG-MED22]|nr:undecaprenyl/decaprenyl-phosphate alpha-N-acetylglucosaminyl 1-phosphate transferase [Pelagibacterales bacterium SAG-MED22]
MVINLILSIIFFSIHFYVENNKKKIFKKSFLDVPDFERKIHNKPTYLIGGHYIFILYIIFGIFSPNYGLNEKIIYFSIISCVFIIGIFDDLIDLKPILKLSLVLSFYLILVHFDEDYLLNKVYFETFDKNLNFGVYSYFISSLCVLLFINAINLIDGINGLAMLVFTILSVFLNYFLKVDLNLFVFIFFIFIYFNIFNGKYFLGNSGSLLIGAIISFSTIKAYNVNFLNQNSAEDIFILFLIPGIDMFRLFIERIIKKKNPFSADRNHLHHFLIKEFSLKKILIFYSLSISVSSYLAFEDYVSETNLIIAVIFSYLSLLYFLKKKLKKFNK